jgi:predicted PurR-regulated permease PerM
MPDRRAVFSAALIVVATALLVLGGIYVVFRLRVLLLSIILAAIMATGLRPLVRRLERTRRLRRGGAATIAFLVFLAGAAALLVSIGIPASRQVQAFFGDTNQYVYLLRARWVSLQEASPWLPDLTGLVDRLLVELKARARPDGKEVAAIGLGLVRGIGGTLTVLAMAFYMLLAPPRPIRWLRWLFPERQRHRLDIASMHVGDRFQKWLRAQLILSTVVGLTSFAGLLALGVPYPHLLALIAAMGELLPVFGPVLAAVPAVLVAMSRSTELTLSVIALAAGIQLLENYVLVPKIMRQVVGLSPLATIIGLIAGYELFGVAGALLAVPTVAALEILVPELATALASHAPLSDGGVEKEAPRDGRAGGQREPAQKVPGDRRSVRQPDEAPSGAPGGT